MEDKERKNERIKLVGNKVSYTFKLLSEEKTGLTDRKR